MKVSGAPEIFQTDLPDVLLMDDQAHLTFTLTESTSPWSQIPILRYSEKTGQLISQNGNDNSCKGVVVQIEKNGQDQALAALGSVEWILVDCPTLSSNEDDAAWQMIPAENLIAAAANSGTKVAFCVKESSDVGGLARALELGVDALCVSISAPVDLWNTVFQAQKERMKIVPAKSTTEAADSGMATVIEGLCWRRYCNSTILADRICIDLVQMLLPAEGLWVGSSAKCLALVLSEAATSKLVPTRPFRINAGPVHSYVLLADESTKYLCEIEPGDQVLVHNSVTRTNRAITVGRIKQEVRPCILVELDEPTTKSKAQVFIQQAETVRLGRDGGKFVRVTELEPSTCLADATTQPVLLRITSRGTHVGKKYDGKVVEK